MKTVFFVRVPMPGRDDLFDLCQCESAEYVGELIRCLLQANKGHSVRYIVETRTLFEEEK